jgi:hypothetical protein
MGKIYTYIKFSPLSYLYIGQTESMTDNKNISIYNITELATLGKGNLYLG